MDNKGRMGAAHVSAQAVRAVAVLSAHCGGRRQSDAAVADAIDAVVELIELSNDYRIKVMFQIEGEEPWLDSDDFDDSAEDVAR